MPKYRVRVLAIESDHDSGLLVGTVDVEAPDKVRAANLAYEQVWDARLSTTCNARFQVRRFPRLRRNPAS